MCRAIFNLAGSFLVDSQNNPLYVSGPNNSDKNHSSRTGVGFPLARNSIESWWSVTFWVVNSRWSSFVLKFYDKTCFTLLIYRGASLNLFGKDMEYTHLHSFALYSSFSPSTITTRPPRS